MCEIKKNEVCNFFSRVELQTVGGLTLWLSLAPWEPMQADLIPERKKNTLYFASALQ